MNRIETATDWMRETVTKKGGEIQYILLHNFVGSPYDHLLAIFVSRNHPDVQKTFNPSTAPSNVCFFDGEVQTMLVVTDIADEFPLTRPLADLPHLADDVAIMVLDGEEYFLGYLKRDFAVDVVFNSKKAVHALRAEPFIRELVNHQSSTLIEEAERAAAEQGGDMGDYVHVLFLTAGEGSNTVLSLSEYTDRMQAGQPYGFAAYTGVATEIAAMLEEEHEMMKQKLLTPRTGVTRVIFNGLGTVSYMEIVPK